MAYAEASDLNLSDQRLVELTDSADATGEVDTDLLALLLAESQAIVDGVIAGAVSVPFADGSVPPLITVVTSWIWAYRIYRHREVIEIPTAIKDDYERAMAMLEKIANGDIPLIPSGGDSGDVTTTTIVPSVSSSSTRGWTSRSEDEL